AKTVTGRRRGCCCRAPLRRRGSASSPRPSPPTSSLQATCHCSRRRTRCHSRWAALWSWRRSCGRASARRTRCGRSCARRRPSWRRGGRAGSTRTLWRSASGGGTSAAW
uniref:Uncharacterized protein n=1 Tax=Triticum urartu TaxID=4572 RepID=A0A8R7V1F0_TRIUA